MNSIVFSDLGEARTCACVRTLDLKAIEAATECASYYGIVTSEAP